MVDWGGSTTTRDAPSRLPLVFSWQNNLLKFYLDTDVTKAIEYAQELIEEVAHMLPQSDVQDLYFSIGTALTLRMSSLEDMDEAVEAFRGALDFGGEVADLIERDERVRSEVRRYQGIIYNNMGMACAQKFIMQSREVATPE